MCEDKKSNPQPLYLTNREERLERSLMLNLSFMWSSIVLVEMPANQVFPVLLVLLLSGLGRSFTANSRARFSVDHKESGRVNEFSSRGSGSLNRDLVIQERVSSQKLQAFDIQGTQNNQDNIRKNLTSSVGSKYNPTVLKNVPKKNLRPNRSPKMNAEFTPSYVVCFLELIMVLCSNVFAHMVRCYKNSVPHDKINIIIVISHYMEELFNILVIFQVCFPHQSFLKVSILCIFQIIIYTEDLWFTAPSSPYSNVPCNVT